MLAVFIEIQRSFVGDLRVESELCAGIEPQTGQDEQNDRSTRNQQALLKVSRKRSGEYCE